MSNIRHLTRFQLLDVIGYQYECLGNEALRVLYAMKTNICVDKYEYWQSLSDGYEDPFLPDEILRIVLTHIIHIDDFISLYTTSKAFQRILSDTSFLSLTRKRLMRTRTSYIVCNNKVKKSDTFKGFIEWHTNLFYHPKHKSRFPIILFSHLLSNGYDTEAMSMIDELRDIYTEPLHDDVRILPSHLKHLTKIPLVHIRLIQNLLGDVINQHLSKGKVCLAILNNLNMSNANTDENYEILKSITSIFEANRLKSHLINNEWCTWSSESFALKYRLVRKLSLEREFKTQIVSSILTFPDGRLIQRFRRTIRNIKHVNALDTRFVQCLISRYLEAANKRGLVVKNVFDAMMETLTKLECDIDRKDLRFNDVEVLRSEWRMRMNEWL